MGTKTNPGKFSCYDKAEPDEPIFVLLGRDPAAALTVRYWISLRKFLSDPERDADQLREAEELVKVLEDYAVSRGKDVGRLHQVTQRAAK